jgi:hypothetical protein
MEIFRGYQARATGPFVIESSGIPKPGLTYEYQRCGHIFRRLVDWLRSKGVTGDKPLHILRKEFGSVINAQAGIHAASRALRHANVAVTDLYYADSRARVTVGLGHLLEQNNEKVTNITKAAADSPSIMQLQTGGRMSKQEKPESQEEVGPRLIDDVLVTDFEALRKQAEKEQKAAEKLGPVKLGTFKE